MRSSSGAPRSPTESLSPPGSPGNACTATDQRGGVRSSPVGTVRHRRLRDRLATTCWSTPARRVTARRAAPPAAASRRATARAPTKRYPTCARTTSVMRPARVSTSPTPCRATTERSVTVRTTCAGGACLPTTPGFNPCNGGPDCNNTCNEAADTASTRSTSPCAVPDANPRTNDVCNGAGSCNHPNNTAPCTDPLFATAPTRAAAARAVSTQAIPCTAGPQCAHTRQGSH